MAPNEPAVLREMPRVFTPGRLIAVCDIAPKKPGRREVGPDATAAAISIGDSWEHLREAGFSSVLVVDTRKDLNAHAQVERGSGCCSPRPRRPRIPDVLFAPAAACRHASLAQSAWYDMNEFAASVQVYAVKG